MRDRPDPRPDIDDIFTFQAVEPGIFAKLVASSGLGRPGQVTADDIAQEGRMLDIEVWQRISWWRRLWPRGLRFFRQGREHQVLLVGWDLPLYGLFATSVIAVRFCSQQLPHSTTKAANSAPMGASNQSQCAARSSSLTSAPSSGGRLISSLDVALGQTDKVRENRVIRSNTQALVQKRLGHVVLANQPAKRLLQERRGEYRDAVNP